MNNNIPDNCSDCYNYYKMQVKFSPGSCFIVVSDV